MPTDRNQFSGNEQNSEQFKKMAESLTGVQYFSGVDMADNQLKSVSPQKVKDLRMFIDNLLIQSKNLSPTREVSLAYTNMQRGFMWLGKVLQGMDQPNPYPESTNVTSPKIEERTDQAKDSPAMFAGMPTDMDRTATVKWFRSQLDDAINRMYAGFGPGSHHATQLAEDALSEAKMWYGQELNNIRLASI